MRDLRARVHAAVRAAGAVNLNRLSGYEQERFVELLLNGNAVFLQLPADVVRAVVGDDQADAAAHSGSFSSTTIPASTAKSSRVAKRSPA